MNALRAVGQVAAIGVSVGAVIFFAALGHALGGLSSSLPMPGDGER